AIRLATLNFNPPHHRPNARRVIVIIASAFESGRYNDPIVAANTFKEDGGIIITIEFVQVHGAPVPLLETLASPGYALSNRYGKLQVWDLHRLFCRANCFCPANYKPFKLKGDTPYGGCYKMSTLPSIQIGSRHCGPPPYCNAIVAPTPSSQQVPLRIVTNFVMCLIEEGRGS
ncbi:unnamed protein product, partial [Strongylus vulgaris]